MNQHGSVPGVGSIIRLIEFSKDDNDEDNHNTNNNKDYNVRNGIRYLNFGEESQTKVVYRSIDETSEQAISLVATEGKKETAEFNWVFWLLIGSGVLLLLIIVVLILRG